MPMKKTDKAFLLRMPMDMHDFFKEQSLKNDRSVNYEILRALREYQEKTEKKEPTPVKE